MPPLKYNTMTIRDITATCKHLYTMLLEKAGGNPNDLPEGFPISRSSLYLLKNGKMPLSWKRFEEVCKYLELDSPKIIL